MRSECCPSRCARTDAPFVQRHGLKDVAGGVALCCSKVHEGAAYIYYDQCFRAVDGLRSGIDPAVPVHWILGTREDFL